MATQTLAYEKLAAAEWEMGASREELRSRTGRHKLLPLPNEHIYLYRKAIDNSRVVRQADPRARAICWRRIATTTAGTLLLVALLWPGMYGMLAGYQIESLKAQQQRLIAEKTTLAVEEARLLSPERLEESAQAQQFIEPAPDQVVFLHPQSDGSLALNVPSK
jgi:hypothetical protein